MYQSLLPTRYLPQMQWQIHLNLHYIIRYITNKVCNVSDKNAKKVIKSMFKNVADGKDVVVTFQN